MAFDARKNFAYSTVATAPSPASSGTSLVVASGDGTKFPAASFNAVIWPVSAQPSTTNAEIVRVTAISTDTFTITRAQEGTSARTVVVGDQIMAGLTDKTLDDIESLLATESGTLSFFIPPYDYFDASSSAAMGSANQVRVALFYLDRKITINSVHFEVATASASTNGSMGIYSSDGNTLHVTTGAVATTSTGLKNTTLGSTVTLDPGFYYFAWTNSSTTPAFGVGLIDANAYNIPNAGSMKLLGTAANASSGGALPSTLGTITAVNLGNIAVCKFNG